MKNVCIRTADKYKIKIFSERKWKKIQVSTIFEPVTSAIPLLCQRCDVIFSMTREPVMSLKQKDSLKIFLSIKTTGVL